MMGGGTNWVMLWLRLVHIALLGLFFCFDFEGEHDGPMLLGLIPKHNTGAQDSSALEVSPPDPEELSAGPTELQNSPQAVSGFLSTVAYYKDMLPVVNGLSADLTLALDFFLLPSSLYWSTRKPPSMDPSKTSGLPGYRRDSPFSFTLHLIAKATLLQSTWVVSLLSPLVFNGSPLSTDSRLINRTFNIPPKSEDEKEEDAKAEEEEEEEKEEIHEVGQNSASFQSKPIENEDPFLRLFKDSGRPNPAAQMVHPIVHKATRDRVNERNTLALGLIPPSPQKSKR
ncbi:hypothetical protein MJG53_008601 [Ovis ammon polii x Ovis aries]|uniref:Uncharacterized protein n=1 Tax=Ovis ammon polii x Ovis aries TaxID=2918886 RepID=A0ACB9V131_9CETA|nr:hypothetical protein MJG53_008601 [Ovis ammon polii x Ovis aries]